MYKILLISTNQNNQFRNEINRTEMDAVVPPFENGLGHFSTQPIQQPNVTSSISASNHHHPIDQSVVANEPLTDNNFEDIFESSTTDCTDIYSELPPLNERKIGNTATLKKCMQLKLFSSRAPITDEKRLPNSSKPRNPSS